MADGRNTKVTDRQSRRALLAGGFGALAALAARPIAAFAGDEQDGTNMKVGGHYMAAHPLNLATQDGRAVLVLKNWTDDIALNAWGRVFMPRNSGVAIVSAGQSETGVDLAVPVGPNTIAFAT